MINHFLDRVEILKTIDPEYYNDTHLITELLICLNKLYNAVSPSFKDIIDTYRKICYDYSVSEKIEYEKIIYEHKYDEEEDIYYEDEDCIVFVFDYKEYCISYTLNKNNDEIIIDEYIFDSILCDLIEETLDELTL